MKILTGALVFITFTACVNFVTPYKILAIFPFASRSHFNVGFRLVKELVNRGHQVDFINPYPQEKPIPNLRDISVAETLKDVDEKRKHLFGLDTASVYGSMYFCLEMGLDITEKVLSSQNVHKLIHSNETYDVVVMEYFLNEAVFGFAHHFNAPLVVVSPLPASEWSNFLVGNPGPSSYVPHLLSQYTSQMTYLQRVQNTLYNIAGFVMKNLHGLPGQEKILRKHFPKINSLNDVLKKVDLILMNSHESITNSVPHVPNMIEIGGYHVHPTKELPKDLKKFLDDAKDGAVLFSMGSNLRSADLSVEKREGILKAFSKYKQKFLWKFEEQLPNLPANVKIEKWLPQQDVLAHPNVVAFISHGGLLGTTESIHFGKPIIGIPIFGDQKMNINLAVSNGYALKISLNKLGEETMTKALNDILNNPKYSKEAQRRSKIYHDRPQKPIDTAIFWIEFAVRHEGAGHLRSSALNLHWYQLHLFDVYAFFITVFLTLSFIMCKLIKLCSTSKKKEVSSKKKKQ